MLDSWRDTATKQAILDYVEQVTQEGGSDYVAPSGRVAVFDNDGTLWCEKPMAIELGFILRRLAEMAQLDETLKDRQPWKAAHEQDFAWIGVHMLEYAGGHRPALRLLVNHDDGEREFDYTAGAEASLERARADGWTVVSVKDDWERVFAS